MTLIVCSVFDSAVQLYGRPIFFRARAEAVRSFTAEVNRGGADNVLSQHPDDYALFQLGEFSEETGLFVQVGPALIVRGKDVYNDAS